MDRPVQHDLRATPTRNHLTIQPSRRNQEPSGTHRQRGPRLYRTQMTKPGSKRNQKPITGRPVDSGLDVHRDLDERKDLDVHRDLDEEVRAFEVFGEIDLNRVEV